MDVLCSVLSILENQTSAAEADFKKIQAAVVAVIDKFTDVHLYGNEIIEQAFRTLTVGRNYSVDSNLLNTLFQLWH